MFLLISVKCMLLMIWALLTFYHKCMCLNGMYRQDLIWFSI